MASSSDPAGKRRRLAPPIPEELVIEICKRMPLESVGRSMCVCKSWKALLSSPFFVAVHHRHYSAPTPRLGLRKGAICDYYSLSDTRFRCFPSVASRYSLRRCNHHNRPVFINEVKGVVCLLMSSGDTSVAPIVLWNPLIRKYVEISKSPRPPLEVDRKRTKLDFGLGLVFDDARDDLMVIRLWKPIQKRQLVCDVYSAQAGAWKRGVIEDQIIPPGALASKAGFFFRGTIHWIVRCDQEEFYYSLLMFECEGERFSTMRLPQGMFCAGKTPTRVAPTLIDYDGKLALVRRPDEIWVMASYSNPSWFPLLGDDVSSGGIVSTASLLLMDHPAAQSVVSLALDNRKLNREYILF